MAWHGTGVYTDTYPGHDTMFSHSSLTTYEESEPKERDGFFYLVLITYLVYTLLMDGLSNS